MSDRIEKEVKDITQSILDDYTKGRAIDDMNDLFNQVDKEAIIDIVTKLVRILFPGHFRDRTYKIYSVNNYLTMLIEDVMFNLKKQIMRVLRYDCRFKEDEQEKIVDEADCATVEFFKKIPQIREHLNTDVQAAFDGDPAAYNKDEIIFSYPGLFAIAVNRIAHELHLLSVPMIPRIMTEYAHGRTGIDIHPGATIGKYFCIDHGTGVVIGESTVIGEHVKVYQGVTLGALSTSGGQNLKGKKRHPTIEDNVTIYSGASILGGGTVIGEGSVIGGNVFITTSVKAGTRVSIKNQELHLKRGGSEELKVEKQDMDQDETWFYMI
jgi:serine O-acetyltransferase